MNRFGYVHASDEGIAYLMACKESVIAPKAKIPHPFSSAMWQDLIAPFPQPVVSRLPRFPVSFEPEIGDPWIVLLHFVEKLLRSQLTDVHSVYFSARDHCIHTVLNVYDAESEERVYDIEREIYQEMPDNGIEFRLSMIQINDPREGLRRQGYSEYVLHGKG